MRVRWSRRRWCSAGRVVERDAVCVSGGGVGWDVIILSPAAPGPFTRRAAGTRSYLSEPDRGRRKWKGKAEAQAAVYANRRRIYGTRGQSLQRLRAEGAERSFPHTYETGGLRRLHLRGRSNIQKRLLIHAAGFNLGLVLRQLLGAGTSRAFAARIRALRKLCWVHLAIVLALERIHRDLQAEMDQYLAILCDVLMLARPGLVHQRSTGC